MVSVSTLGVSAWKLKFRLRNSVTSRESLSNWRLSDHHLQCSSMSHIMPFWLSVSSVSSVPSSVSISAITAFMFTALSYFRLSLHHCSFAIILFRFAVSDAAGGVASSSELPHQTLSSPFLLALFRGGRNVLIRPSSLHQSPSFSSSAFVMILTIVQGLLSLSLPFPPIMNQSNPSCRLTCSSFSIKWLRLLPVVQRRANGALGTLLRSHAKKN